MYQLDKSRLDLRCEFRANLFGERNPDLESPRNLTRAPPKELFPVPLIEMPS
jgi:hypothetical protein